MIATDDPRQIARDLAVDQLVRERSELLVQLSALENELFDGEAGAAEVADAAEAAGSLVDALEEIAAELETIDAAEANE